jgi:hypothetical protein
MVHHNGKLQIQSWDYGEPVSQFLRLNAAIQKLVGVGSTAIS